MLKRKRALIVSRTYKAKQPFHSTAIGKASNKPGTYLFKKGDRFKLLKWDTNGAKLQSVDQKVIFHLQAYDFNRYLETMEHIANEEGIQRRSWKIVKWFKWRPKVH